MLSQKQIEVYQKDIVAWVNDLVFFPVRRKIEKIFPWHSQEWMLREATEMIEIDGEKCHKYTVACFGLPKRNSKTFLAAILGAWNFSMFYNVESVIASNSKEQSASTAFDSIKKIILNSPELFEMVGEQNILDKEIRNLDTQSKIVVVSSEKASSWGYPIDIAVVDEIHAAPDGEGLYQVLASQTGDRDGQIILPSQVSPKSNIFYKLWELAGSPVYEHDKDSGKLIQIEGDTPVDERIFFVYLADKVEKPKEYVKYNISPLISRAWLSSREKQLTGPDYNAFHRNIWIGAGGKLFSQEHLDEGFLVGKSLRVPVGKEEIKQLEHDFKTKFVIGAGLDRSLPYSKKGDRSVWTVTAKGWLTGFDSPLPFYIILNQVVFLPGLDGEYTIKKTISEDFKRYSIDNTIFEVYQAADLCQWAEGMGRRTELIHATDNRQIPMFTDLYQFHKGRLVFPGGLMVDVGDREGRTFLRKELDDFEQTVKGDLNSLPKFGHPGKYNKLRSEHTEVKTKYHDDAVYSLGWSIYATREERVYEHVKRKKRDYGLLPLNKFAGR